MQLFMHAAHAHVLSMKEVHDMRSNALVCAGPSRRISLVFDMSSQIEYVDQESGVATRPEVQFEHTNI